MRIERINDISEILKCLPFEREIRKRGRDSMREADMLMTIQALINTPLFGFWIAYDDNSNISGYVFGFMSPIPGNSKLHIFRIYAKDKALFKQFEDILIEWAKQYKVRVGQITTNKHVKGFQKLFGYTPVSINMEKKYY